MSTTLAHLLSWSERLSEKSSEEADVLRAMIARRESGLRAKLFQLMVAVSQRENWEAYRFEATARWAEQIPVAHLEALVEHLQHRLGGQKPAGAREVLPVVSAPVQAQDADPVQERSIEPPRIALKIAENIHALETNVAQAPVVAAGLQGIRIMQLVALMSKSRGAEMSQRRISGIQAIYRHA